MNTLKSSPSNRELLSALADGELDRHECAQLLESCAQDASALASWNAYQLIGDVLRSPAPALRGGDADFLARFNARLAQEAVHATAVATEAPVILLDAQPNHKPAQEAATVVPRHRGDAANDGVFRWKLVAGFASLAAVCVVGWNVMGQQAPVAVQLAQDSVPAGGQKIVVASPQGPMVRDARLEELLAAHKQMGGTSALQVPSGFLRNATFETPQSPRR